MFRVVFALVLLLGLSERSLANDPIAPAADPLFKMAASVYADIRAETLPNGLRVYLKPIPGSPIVSTMVAYKVGAADEELDQTGLSHYLEHLMFKGTDKLFPGDIDRMTQRNGGMNNAYTTEDMTVYFFDFAADRWTTALDIEADRMRNLKIDKRHEFEQEKGAVVAELNRNEDTPWDLEYKRILPMLFGAKTPYGHSVIGERSHVEGVTAEVIKRYYDRWYHPNNAAIVIVGGFDEKQAMEKIKALFSGIPKAELPERKPIPKQEIRKEIVRQKMTSKFETPKLLMGFNTVVVGHPDDYVLDVISAALSSGKTSRLYRKLVEQEKLVNTVETNNSVGRYPGWFSVSAELFKDDLAKVEGIVFAELKKLAEEGLGEAEMKRIKRAVLASNIFRNESVPRLARSIAESVTHSDLDYVKNYLPRVASITNDDIKRVARKYFVDAKPAILWSLPEAPMKGDSGPRSPSHRAAARLSAKSLEHARYADAKGGGAFRLEDAKQVDLPNGMKLLLLENHRLPLVVAQASLRNTRMYETPEKSGLSQLMGELLDEGTKTRKGEQIAQLIEDTGGALSLGSGGGSFKVLTPDLDLGLDLLLDCMMNPTFPADKFKDKQQQQLADIAEQSTQPNYRARTQFQSMVYGKHPYGLPISGTLETVKKLTREDCVALHAKLFVPNNVVMAIVGDFNSEKLIEQIKKRTAAWKSKDLPPLPKFEIEKPASYIEKIITDPEASQLHVYLGHVGITRQNPDYYKLLVMDNVLGTGPGFTDRLSSNLRDRQGLAYTVQAVISRSAGQQPGLFIGYIGTFPDKFTWVKDGFLKEIQRIRTEVPSKEEVEDAKKYLTGSLAFELTTSDEVAGMLVMINRYQLGLDYLDTYRHAVNAVTPEDVRVVAEKYLDPKRLILIACGAIDSSGKPLKK